MQVPYGADYRYNSYKDSKTSGNTLTRESYTKGTFMIRILTIDDEVSILTLLENILSKDGYFVEKVSNPLQVLRMNLSCFDLILLDIMMPEMDGFTLCRTIRPYISCPLIFLTAKSEEEDAVFGLGLGADDYLRKPFGAAELRAKVAAHLRRERREKHSFLAFEKIRIDLSSREIWVQDTSLVLTKSEYELCEFLARHPGQVFSRDQILASLYGWETESDASTISVHVGNIRAKFEQLDVMPIQTVWGVGYKWIA